MTQSLQEQNDAVVPSRQADKTEISAEEVSSEIQSAEPESSEESTESASDELVITSKSSAPKFQSLDKTQITIGRESTNDISLGGTAVSRHHARLEKRDQNWYVIDLGSTNGTFLAKERLVANSDYTWQSGHPLQVGAYTLQWQSPRDLLSGQTLVIMPGEMADRSDGVDKAKDQSLAVELDKPEIEIEVGQSATIKLKITNEGAEEKTLGISIFGVSDHWIELPQTSVKLGAEKSQTVLINLTIPQSMLIEAGGYDYEVQLQDAHAPTQMTRTIGKIIVPAVHDFSLRMVKGPGENLAPLELTLKNLGNVPAIYTLSKEADPGLDVSGRQWSVSLTPGLKLVTDFQVLATSRPLLGSNETRSLTISMQDESGKIRSATTSIDVTPRIPVWMLVSSIILFLIGLAFIVITGG